MGCSGSRAQPELNHVDAMLKAAHEQDEMNPKILLLGAGESGKSTVVKQVKLIWKVGGGMSDREKSDYRNALRRNTIESIQVLIEASRTLNIALDDSSLTVAKEISELQTDADIDQTLAKKISDLWNDKGIQTTYDRRSEFWSLDATPYYLSEVYRFASEFDVSEEDVLMARIRTTGIVVTQVPDPPYVYHVVDVGGQRSERRKWIHCFDNVNAIIFLEGLSGYNQGKSENVKGWVFFFTLWQYPHSPPMLTRYQMCNLFIYTLSQCCSRTTPSIACMSLCSYSKTLLRTLSSETRQSSSSSTKRISSRR